MTFLEILQFGLPLCLFSLFLLIHYTHLMPLSSLRFSSLINISHSCFPFFCSVFNYINPWSGLKIEIVWTPNSASRCSNVTLSCVSPFLLCIVHFLSLNFSAINIQSIQIYLLLITLYQFLTNNNICSTRSSTSFVWSMSYFSLFHELPLLNKLQMANLYHLSDSLTSHSITLINV